jgi:endonuclease-3 related protein
MTDLDKYEDLRRYFEGHLSNDLRLYQEFHALIVELGKNYCKTKPDCAPCPLRKECRFSQ